MRRRALLAIVALGAGAELLAHRTASAQEAFGVERVIERDGHERDDDQFPSRRSLDVVAMREATLEPHVQRLRTHRWRATATFVRVTSIQGAVAGVVDGATALLDDASLDALRHAPPGAVSVEHVLRATGVPGEIASATDGTIATLLLGGDGESSVGGSSVAPVTGRVREGARAVVGIASSGDGRWRVAYRLLWSDTATTRTVDRLGDRIDFARVPTTYAEGMVDLRSGETAVVRVVDGSRRGRLMLLRVDGEAPTGDGYVDLGDGSFAVPAPPIEDPTDEIRLAPPGLGDDDDAGAVRAVPTRGARWSEKPWGGFLIGSNHSADEPVLRAEFASRRGAGVVELVRRDGERVTLPTAPRSKFAAFSGAVHTRADGWRAVPACESRLLLHDEVAVGHEGLSFAGAAMADGTVDLAFASREIVGAVERDVVGRRGLRGHRTTAPVEYTLDLVTTRETALVCTVPADDPRVGDDLSVRCLFPPDTTPAPQEATLAPPVVVTVGNARVPLRPGKSGAFVNVVRQPFRMRWKTDGWCGMTGRLPLTDHADLGASAHIELAADGRSVGVQAEVRGEAEPRAAFDPLDGEVEIVRAPCLRYAAESLVPPHDGIVAWSGPLRLRVALPGAVGERLRVALGDDSGCVVPTEGRAAFSGGGVTMLPVDLNVYTSNHFTGELSTAFSFVEDGWSLRREKADALAIERRSMPEWTRRELRRKAVPAREGFDRGALAYVRRSHRALDLFVAPGRGVDRAAMPGDLPRIVVTREGLEGEGR